MYLDLSTHSDALPAHPVIVCVILHGTSVHIFTTGRISPGQSYFSKGLSSSFDSVFWGVKGANLKFFSALTGPSTMPGLQEILNKCLINELIKLILSDIFPRDLFSTQYL